VVADPPRIPHGLLVVDVTTPVVCGIEFFHTPIIHAGGTTTPPTAM
jgi:hypothetical protein